MKNKQFEKSLDERIKGMSDVVKRMEAGKIKATRSELSCQRGFLEACKVIRADYDYHRKRHKPVNSFKAPRKIKPLKIKGEK